MRCSSNWKEEGKREEKPLAPRGEKKIELVFAKEASGKKGRLKNGGKKKRRR